MRFVVRIDCSLAVGVGQLFDKTSACRDAAFPRATSRTAPSGERMRDASLAVGVGHCRIASVSVVPECARSVVDVARAEERESATIDVGHAKGQEEEPFALVRRADVRSLRQDDRHAETCAVQVSDDVVEAASQMTAHVLAEEPPGAALFGDAQDVRPEVARVVGAASQPGVGEGLAGVPTHHEIHRATPRSSVERSEVRPDRRRSQASLFHARDKACRGIGFPLDSNHGSDVCVKGEVEPEVEPASAGAEGSDSEERAIGGTYSHVTRAPS